MEMIADVVELVKTLTEAILWGAGFTACYRLYDCLLAKAGWKGEDDV